MKCSTAALSLLLALHLPLALAQNACSSDGAAAPRALYERFLSADCADCWAEAGFAPGADAAVLDWIVPAPSGQAAPLSAAARSDALVRLHALQRPPPLASGVHVATVAQRLPGRLRVAFGPAVNDYVGTAASYHGALPAGATGAADSWTLWLALVEQVPAGAEATPIPRNLVRNLFQRRWDKGEQLLKTELKHLPRDTRWIERRPMQLAHGTDPARLALIAWMEDASGQLVASAQAQCAGAR